MRTSSLLVCALVSGCAGRYHTELVGNGTAIVQPRTDATADATATPWAVGGGIQLAAGTYDLAMWFDIPRAQEIEWTVQCPGVQLSGIAGETFERYRERRLADLREQVRRDRERTAAVTSTVVGAFAPSVTVGGNVGPVRVQGEARVNADAVGAVVAEHAITDDVMLPAGDVGRGRLAKSVHVTTTGAGQCVVTAIADDPSVLATYQVMRIRDLDAEARLAVMAERSAAMSVRTRLQARLVAHGADAELRERERRVAVEAHVSAEAEAQAAVELRIRVQAEQEERWRILALHARTQLRGRCEGHGADPNRRARIVEEQRVAAEAEVRLRADLEQRRLDVALHARTSLRDRLVRFGAIPRPPMPALIPEEPGTAPFEGAVWIDGKWAWVSGQWVWNAGGWTDSDVFTEVGGAEPTSIDDGGDVGGVIDDLGGIVDVGIDVGSAITTGGGRRPGVRVVRDRPRPHRPHPPREPSNNVHTAPTVLDNRHESRPAPDRDANRDDDRRDDHKKPDDGARMQRIR